MTKRLLYLNGLAILMIPLQHACSYALQAMFVFMWASVNPDAEVPNYSLLGSFPYHVITFLRQFSTFSVPGFLVISGFFISFFARGKDANMTLGQVLPRVKVLLYPFVIWTVLRFILLRSFPKTLDDVLQPYNFVPLLIQFYLLSPFLVKVAKERWKLLLIVSAILHLGIQFFRYTYDLGVAIPGQTLVLQLTPRWIFYGQQPFWFPFGIVLGLHAKDIYAKLGTMRWQMLFGTILFMVLMMVEYYVVFSINGEAWQGETFAGSNFSGILRTFFILFMLLFILSLEEGTLLAPKFVSEIGTRSLGIYLANIPSIYVVAVLMYRFTPAILANQLLYLAILVSAGLGIPLLLMFIVRHLPLPFRSIYRYVFG